MKAAAKPFLTAFHRGFEVDSEKRLRSAFPYSTTS